MIQGETQTPAPILSSMRKGWWARTFWLLFFVLLVGGALWERGAATLKPHDGALVIATIIGALWLVRAITGGLFGDPNRRPASEVEKYFEHYDNRAIVRYSIAAVFLCGGFWIPGEVPHYWWFPIPAALMAGYFARELSVFLLVVVAGILLYRGVAALPVSVAVVIGALIIAMAIRKSR